jgi:SAM-dependent methyltransferase
MAHPLCRRAINRRVSGSEDEWPLDWFARIIRGRQFGRGLSWGCGLGAFERAAIRAGIVTEIDAFDVSAASLEEAGKAAAGEGVAGIRYGLGNFNDPRLQPSLYDIVFFHASLHHVAALERLFHRLANALKPRGWIYIDEYVGPSRSHWSPSDLKLAQAVLDMIPAEFKLRSRLEAPIEVNDPSEAVRSDEIPRFLLEFFDILEWRPYGGQITDLVMPCVSSEWAASEEGSKFIRSMLDIEDWELAAIPSSNHHLVAFGRLKGRAGSASPFFLEASAALKRRLARFRHRSPSG